MFYNARAPPPRFLIFPPNQNFQEVRMNKPFYIYVKRQAVEVSHEIYVTYHSMVANAQYQKRRDKKHGTIHFTDLDTDELLGEEMIPSGQISNPVEQAFFDKCLIENLYTAIAALDDFEKKLLREIYFADKSQRALSRELGIPRRTLDYQVNRTLAKLRILMSD